MALAKMSTISEQIAAREAAAKKKDQKQNVTNTDVLLRKQKIQQT